MAAGGVFRLEVDGVVEMQTAFSRFAEYIDDMREPLNEVADYLKKVVEGRFAAGGPGWAPLSPAYAARKPAGKPILVLSGDMQSSMGNVRRIINQQLEWGTDDPKAIFHQRGTVNMPKRRIIHLEPDDARYIHRVLQRYLSRKAHQAGLNST